jgi:hypothetical protein
MEQFKYLLFENLIQFLHYRKKKPSAILADQLKKKEEDYKFVKELLEKNGAVESGKINQMYFKYN